VTAFHLDRVCVAGTDRSVLSDVSLDVPEAGVTVVVGPSGAGKSTLLRLLNRLEVPSSGSVTFRGGDVAGLDPLALRRRVGMVFQRPTLFGGTVRDNLSVAAPGLPADAYRAVLERVDLPAAFLDRPADELSGGEAQRVCLARALMAEPEVLLMDEPTSALDERPRLALERLTRALAEGGMPVVWVTHQLDQMRRLADRVVVLLDGSVVFTGTPADLDATPDAAVAAFVSGASDDD
jgi:putative ABC transport system ATP-binding protein